MTGTDTITGDLMAELALAKGDLVECEAGGSVCVCRWVGRTGRDEAGRFVRHGDPREGFRLACGVVYTRRDVDQGRIRVRRLPH